MDSLLPGRLKEEQEEVVVVIPSDVIIRHVPFV